MVDIRPPGCIIGVHMATPISETAPLSPREVAARLGIGIWRVRDLIRSGRLPCLRFGHRTVRVTAASVAALEQVRAEEGAREVRGLSVKEVGKILNVSPWTVRAWIRAGRLRSISTGPAGYRIAKPDVMRWIRATTVTR